MVFAQHGIHLIDYQTYRMPGCKLPLRGPACDLSRPYLAFLGGTETFGRFMDAPFVTLVGQQSDAQALNLGCMNAGPDVYLNTPELLHVACEAKHCIVELFGAHNQCNQYYSVHPLRNDRFVCPSHKLMLLYPEVDFSDITFTRHLMKVLKTVSRRRFALVREELQKVWVQKMNRLLGCIGPTILLWFAQLPPVRSARGIDLSFGPLFVTPQMIHSVCGDRRLVSVVPDRAMTARGRLGLMYTQLEEAAAETQLGSEAHYRSAQALLEALAETSNTTKS